MSSRQVESRGTTLAGSTIVVTRPLHQAGPISRRIAELGGDVIRFPTLAIVAQVSEDAMAVVENLEAFDLAVFVSANAVWHGVPLVRERGRWPVGVRLAAVGSGTAEAMRAQALSVDIEPDTAAGSGGLLACAELQSSHIAGRRVAVFRGHGGLADLGDELTARGAEVRYAEVYRRERPAGNAIALNARGLQGEIDIIVVTSGDALRNLFAMLGAADRDWLLRTQFLVVSERVARIGVELDLQHLPIVASGAADQDIVDALLVWHEQKGQLR